MHKQRCDQIICAFYDRLCYGYSKKLFINRIHNLSLFDSSKLNTDFSPTRVAKDLPTRVAKDLPTEIVFHGTNLKNVHNILLYNLRPNMYSTANGIYVSRIPHVHAMTRPLFGRNTTKTGYLFGCFAHTSNIIKSSTHCFTHNDYYDTIEIPLIDPNSETYLGQPPVLVLKSPSQIFPQILIEYTFENSVC